MNNYGDKKRSPLVIALAWVASVVSLLLVYGAASAMVNALLGFRSCDSNSAGLRIITCGKQSVTMGDVLIGLLLLLTIALSVSLFTGAWRATKRRKK